MDHILEFEKWVKRGDELLRTGKWRRHELEMMKSLLEWMLNAINKTIERTKKEA